LLGITFANLLWQILSRLVAKLLVLSWKGAWRGIDFIELFYRAWHNYARADNGPSFSETTVLADWDISAKIIFFRTAVSKCLKL
jgi:hypothetical protein